MNFAKIFQIDDDTQVLIRLEDDIDETTGDDVTNVIQSTEIYGVRVDTASSFLEIERAEQCFKNYTFSKAITFYENSKKIIQDTK